MPTFKQYMTGNQDIQPIKPQHDIRRAEIISDQFTFCSRVFYIRQSDERVDLGEVCSFKAEFEADVDLDVLGKIEGAPKS